MINRCSPTKTETATEGGLDPTVESIGVVQETYHERGRLSTLDADDSPCSCGLPTLLTVSEIRLLVTSGLNQYALSRQQLAVLPREVN